jgi:hypothetical protein
MDDETDEEEEEEEEKEEELMVWVLYRWCFCFMDCTDGAVFDGGEDRGGERE